MTVASVETYQPVARTEYLGRLAILSSSETFGPELWAEVHDEVQASLMGLETEIGRKVPALRATAGRTKGDNFFLFSYRTFSTSDGVIDPVVVGLTFTPSGQGVTVEADASGEQTGDWISSVASKSVGSSRDELLAAIRESARKLCESNDAIVAALEDPLRKVG
jgi:hypothetical protein